MNRKIFAVVLCLTFIFAPFFGGNLNTAQAAVNTASINCYAAAYNATAYTGTPVTSVNVNDNFVAVVELTDMAAFSAIALPVHFNPAIVQVVSYTTAGGYGTAVADGVKAAIAPTNGLNKGQLFDTTTDPDSGLALYWSGSVVANASYPLVDNTNGLIAIAGSRTSQTAITGTQTALVIRFKAIAAGDPQIRFATSADGANKFDATAPDGARLAGDAGELTISQTGSALTVAAAPVAVTGVMLNKDTTTIAVGTADTLIATVDPPEATNKNVTWISSNTGVATVANGVVTAVAAGNATITVRTADGNFEDTCAVTVVDAPVAVTGVALNPTTLTLNVGGATGTLTPVFTPSTATNKSVTWSSSNTGVATVANGVVTPVAAGTATITVRTADGNFEATCAVTVNVPVTGVALNPTTLNLAVGGATGTLTPVFTPANATNQNVTWTSSNTSVATVANGVVTAVAAGSATITVRTADGSFEATCAVTVTQTPSDPPVAGNITVNNNRGTDDVITISGLALNDVVKVYNVASGGTAIGTATVTSGTTATVNISQLGSTAGSIWATVTSTNKSESTRVEKAYIAEPTFFNITTSSSTVGGIKVTANITATAEGNANAGNETVIFALMSGTTPVSIVALERDIQSSESATAFFSVASGTYTVNVFIVDTFSNALTSNPRCLADKVTVTP